MRVLSLYCLLFCFAATASLLGQIEICDNGIDDDNDGLIDIADEDCLCEIIEPISLIPNPSFEEMNCCPDDRSQLNCASDWIQASEPTTDFIHMCGWMGWDNYPPPQPFPDGEGIMGFRDGRVRSDLPEEALWKEYAGACLISPLLKDSIYRFEFDVGFVDAEKSPPINISFFGTQSCDYLPFGEGDPAFGCPTNGPNWKKLDEVQVTGGAGNVWVHTSLEIIPDEDIYAIAIGPDCPPIFSEVGIYYFFDNLLLSGLQFFDFQMSESGHPCDPDFVLAVPYNSDFEYQWYLHGVALAGETFSKLNQNYGEGLYQVRIVDNNSCRISAAYEYVKPSFETPTRVAICKGDIYKLGNMELTERGFYLDTLSDVNNCDSIVPLELEVIGERYDTIEVSILDGNSYSVEDYRFEEPGDYPLVLESSLGCDSLLLLKLTSFTVYIPSAFSPNNDSMNEIFKPFSAEGLIKSIDMKIYDRWGNLIYQGSEWDGVDSEPNVFAYRIDIEFMDGESEVFYGSVTLIR